jgi:predicted DNA-binding helix-hairpin-helix protein
VDRLLGIRRWQRIRLGDLTRLHVPVKKALPFIQTADHNPHLLGLDRDAVLQRLAHPAQQLELFAPPAPEQKMQPVREASTVTGEF